MRIQLGETFYWDVLVKQAGQPGQFETKTLDLAAPHNAAAFEDVEALQAVAFLQFAYLQPGASYWIKDMRLVRTAADPVRVLPPCRQDGLLFHGGRRSRLTRSVAWQGTLTWVGECCQSRRLPPCSTRGPV